MRALLTAAVTPSACHAPRSPQESHCCQIQGLAANTADAACRNLFATAAHGQVRLLAHVYSWFTALRRSSLPAYKLDRTIYMHTQVTIYDDAHLGDHLAVVAQYAPPHAGGRVPVSC